MIFFRFLSSITFALILIGLTAAFVMAGTFLESHTSSHELAEAWIYHHPLFHILLGGYFINILFSALSRWPFKTKHIPFLITHLGLLMVISGIFIKSIYGTQGHIYLIEGTAADTLVLPHQKAILVEKKHPRTSLSIPLSHSIGSGWSLDTPNGLPLQLISWHPHGEEKYISWIHQDHVNLYGFPPLPLQPQALENTPLTVFGGREETIEKMVEEARKRQDKEFLLIHQDNDGNTTLIAGDPYGLFFTEHFDSGHLKSWVAYDDGFLGYSLQAKIPIYDRESQLIDVLKSHSNARLSPPLELFRDAAQKIHEDFPASFAAYLKAFADQGTWLFPFPPPHFHPLLEHIDWENLPSGEFKALYWMAALFEESHFLENLRDRNWPLLDSLEKIESSGSEEEKKQAQFLSWMHQLYEARDQLPYPLDSISPELASAMLSAFLRLYGIHLKDIPLSDNRYMTLESPLRRRLTPSKKEEAPPYVIVQWEDRFLPLAFDAEGTRLKWPAGDSNTLLRFQKHRISLPYEIRLHQAKETKYPGSQQTFSYECVLSIRNKSSQKTTQCTLKMNQVYETAEGFRFYLAGMGQVDTLGAKSVQVIVNRDPAKYFLTYPGGGLIAAGMILLFWRRKKS
jgi:hypothetical protein